GPLAFLAVAPSNELIKELAEFTLVLILFSDASRVGLHELRADAGLYLRLLGAALPVTIGLGTLLALAMFGGGNIWLALLVGAARQRGWIAEGFAGSAGLGLAVCTYASALALHGNGFIAAFVGGLAFGTARGRRGEPLVPFVEETGALVSLLVWLTFGAVAVAP